MSNLLVAAEGGYQAFTLQGGEFAVLALSGAAAMLSTACRSTTPPPFVQHGSPTALTLGPSSGGQHPQFEGNHQVPDGCATPGAWQPRRRHGGEHRRGRIVDV